MRLWLFPLIHFDVWGFTAKTASADDINAKLRRAAVAWRAFLTAFLTLTRIHANVLFDYSKNKLRLDLTFSRECITAKVHRTQSIEVYYINYKYAALPQNPAQPPAAPASRPVGARVGGWGVI